MLSKEQLSDLKVGDKVFYSFEQRINQWTEAREIEITAIGRKYFEAGRMKFYLDNGTQDTDYPGGELFPTYEAWQSKINMLSMWGRVRSLTDTYSPPPNLTNDDLAQLIAILTKTDSN